MSFNRIAFRTCCVVWKYMRYINDGGVNCKIIANICFFCYFFFYGCISLRINFEGCATQKLVCKEKIAQGLKRAHWGSVGLKRVHWGLKGIKKAEKGSLGITRARFKQCEPQLMFLKKNIVWLGSLRLIEFQKSSVRLKRAFRGLLGRVNFLYWAHYGSSGLIGDHWDLKGFKMAEKGFQGIIRDHWGSLGAHFKKWGFYKKI